MITRKRKLSEEQIQQAVASVLAGESLKTVAATAGISTDTLRSYCRGSGVEFMKRSRLVRQKQSLTSLQMDLVKDILANGPLDIVDFSARTGKLWYVVRRSLQCTVFVKESDGFHLDWTLRSWWEEQCSV